MKGIGIVRKIDEFGRIVLPKELRTVMDIEIKDPIEIFVDQDYIMLKKYNPTCILCGSMKDLVNFEGKNICLKCTESFIKK